MRTRAIGIESLSAIVFKIFFLLFCDLCFFVSLVFLHLPLALSPHGNGTRGRQRYTREERREFSHAGFPQSAVRYFRILRNYE